MRARPANVTVYALGFLALGLLAALMLGALGALLFAAGIEQGAREGAVWLILGDPYLWRVVRFAGGAFGTVVDRSSNSCGTGRIQAPKLPGKGGAVASVRPAAGLTRPGRGTRYCRSLGPPGLAKYGT